MPYKYHLVTLFPYPSKIAQFLKSLIRHGIRTLQLVQFYIECNLFIIRRFLHLVIGLKKKCHRQHSKPLLKIPDNILTDIPQPQTLVDRVRSNEPVCCEIVIFMNKTNSCLIIFSPKWYRPLICISPSMRSDKFKL